MTLLTGLSLSILRPGRTALPIFTLYVSNVVDTRTIFWGVSTMDDVIWWINDPIKVGVYIQFQVGYIGNYKSDQVEI